MGTEIFQYGPGKAEKNKIENILVQIQNHDQRLGFTLEGHSTFTFE